MYSLHDITSVCPKLEPIAVDDVTDCRQEERLCLQKQSNGHVDSFAVVPPDNNNTVTMATSQLDQYKKASFVNTSIPERTTTNGTSPYDVKSIGTIEAQVSNQAYATGVSVGEIPEGQILNVYTAVPVYENGGHEVYYYSVGTQDRGIDNQAGTGGTYGYAPDSYESVSSKQTVVPEGYSTYQSSGYGTMLGDQMDPKRSQQPYDMVSQEKASLYQMNTYGGTHRAMTTYEIGPQPRHTCGCSCHQTSHGSSHIPAFGLRNERPSVIMVPASWNDSMSAAKVESLARVDLQHREYEDMDDSDSSDEGDEDGKPEKYFRKNIDGTTARFKLTKEEWKRIPINTFPSGGRLLSGDWTRIFLSKVKESNPWCSLRFKNNHVRSENSRKIHSAVFFRGGAECKRPECNVKVRFVIRKEKGKHVDVTYVGDVCHNSQPGGSDVLSDRRRKRCVRRSRFPSTLVE
ncbi:uncharacterized protein LOC144634873 [Oculina patagonica]